MTALAPGNVCDLAAEVVWCAAAPRHDRPGMWLGINDSARWGGLPVKIFGPVVLLTGEVHGCTTWWKILVTSG